MNEYYILIGAILLIILIDFTLKKIRDKKKDKKTEIFITIKRALTNLFFFTLIILVLIEGYFLYEFQNLFESYEEADAFENVLVLILLISFILLLILNFKKILKKIKDFYNWIINRKRNISLMIFSVIPLKILFHYFLFTEISDSKIKNWYTDDYLNFYEHVNLTFDEELWIFALVIFLILYFSWFFNDKIKAR